MWINVRWIIVLIAVEVSSKCSDFFPDQRTTLEELPPLFMPTKIGEKVNLRLPQANNNNVKYHLTKPNGAILEIIENNNYNKVQKHRNKDVLHNRINKDSKKSKVEKSPHDKAIVKHLINNVSEANGIGKTKHDKVFYSDIVNKEPTSGIEKIPHLKSANNGATKVLELKVGPVTEDDFGNWVISMCSFGLEGVVEKFQVISIHVEENINTVPNGRVLLSLHDDLKLRFASPIPRLQSCELVSPSSTFDKAYDVDLEHLGSCGFVVKNLTAEDGGKWGVVGVGDIVFRGEIDVAVNKKFL